EGEYVGDLTLPGMLEVGFARSPHAHARIRQVCLGAARALPGVVAAFTAGDLPEVAEELRGMAMPPGLRVKGSSPLATDTVRYVGEPVAVVVAENRYALADALESAEVEYEPLPAVVELEEALAGETLVWEDIPRNEAVDFALGFGEVDAAFAAAEVVVQLRLDFP